MRESDRIYFARRAREERDAAERAASPEARESHARLAERYADVAAALENAGDDAGPAVTNMIVSRVSIDAERARATSDA